MTKASIDAHVASLLLILPVLCSSMGFVITQPATGSVVELDGDKGVVISFRYSRAAIPKLTVRVDVMGYPDPNGWPYVSVEGEGGGGSGTLVSGRVRVWGLEPGAVNIRIRCISEDGNNAVAEGTAVYFLSPSEVTKTRILDTQPQILQKRCPLSLCPQPSAPNPFFDVRPPYHTCWGDPLFPRSPTSPKS